MRRLWLHAARMPGEQVANGMSQLHNERVLLLASRPLQILVNGALTLHSHRLIQA
jgi:hypothetical protein